MRGQDMEMNDGLERFLIAQQNYFRTALEEIQEGQKQSHWMWFIFPQIQGLGYSEMARYYAIKDYKEAQAFIEDTTLGRNLIEISQALLKLDSNDATAVMGRPDDLKLKSSMTLFALVSPEHEVFQKVLDKFFHGQRDQKTIELLKQSDHVTTETL
jgi:uncharacterized protein (DUF1810 family)